MTKKRITLKALIASAVSMLLCVSMLIGTTFAWFRSTATNSNNMVTIGEFKVDLLMDKEKNGDYVSISSTENDIFAGITNKMWEPGKTEIVYLKVENQGNLAMKYNIQLNVTEDIGEAASAFKYAIVSGATKDTENIGSWIDIKANSNAKVMSLGEVSTVENGTLLAKNEENDNDVAYFALALHMNEEANSADLMNKIIKFDVTVLATQTTVEEDSYNKNYDLDATFVPETNLLPEAGTSGTGNALITTYNDAAPTGNTYKVSIKVKAESAPRIKLIALAVVGGSTKELKEYEYGFKTTDIGNGWIKLESTNNITIDPATGENAFNALRVQILGAPTDMQWTDLKLVKVSSSTEK